MTLCRRIIYCINTVISVIHVVDNNDLNFSGGPGALPKSVLSQVQEAIVSVPDVGLSILGISHRSDWFCAVISELEANIKLLLSLPDEYHVLFLQGGATQQFSMIPMSLMINGGAPPDYLHTGYWSGKALADASRVGAVRTVWRGEDTGFRQLPCDEALHFADDAPYFHYASNETVEGLQFHRIPGRDDVPRICDMSSDFLSAPLDAERFSLIYAHAQKNIGPAGVTIVLIREGLLRNTAPNLPSFLDYRSHVTTHSLFNTPPVFAIYVVLLVTRWLINDVGGLERMGAANREKASLIYQAMDDSDWFYQGRVNSTDRSLMNVTFKLPTEELERKFLVEAEQAGFSGLAGHRAIGGVRASIYNGLSLQAAEELVAFMEAFRLPRQ